MSIHRVLVTGGAGFIGSHTVDLLLEKNHEVVVLDNLSNTCVNNLNLNHPNLVFVEGDVLAYSFLKDIVSKVDAILHLAAVASVQASIDNFIYTFQVNLQGFLHILQALKELKQKKRLVFASSAAVYGNTAHLPCHEQILTTPSSPYALEKLNMEQYADLFKQLHDIDSLALRYFNVYGPRQNPNSPYSGVISRFIEAYQQGNELTIYGDGTQARDFIYVADIAYANYLALHNNYHGVLNIATGKPVTLLALIKALEAVGNKKTKLTFEAARPGDIHLSFAACDAAKQQLNFQATTSLSIGLAETLAT
jgi:UDP-glucose 4-epimerase